MTDRSGGEYRRLSRGDTGGFRAHEGEPLAFREALRWRGGSARGYRLRVDAGVSATEPETPAKDDRHELSLSVLVLDESTSGGGRSRPGGRMLLVHTRRAAD